MNRRPCWRPTALRSLAPSCGGWSTAAWQSSSSPTSSMKRAVSATVSAYCGWGARSVRLRQSICARLGPRLATREIVSLMFGVSPERSEAERLRQFS